MRIWLVALGSGKMTTENHNKFELYMAGQSGCTYSMQCAVVILKIEARPGCTIITKGCCSSVWETNKNKKVTFKLQKGLDFTVDVEFWFATMISVKQPGGKKNAYCVILYDVKNGHFCSSTN